MLEASESFPKIRFSVLSNNCNVQLQITADAFMALHSITDTAWKNKQLPFEAILALY